MNATPPIPVFTLPGLSVSWYDRVRPLRKILYPLSSSYPYQIKEVDKKNAQMEHIRNIQELVDENKESMPTGVVADVMRECQEAHDTPPPAVLSSWHDAVNDRKRVILEERDDLLYGINEKRQKIKELQEEVEDERTEYRTLGQEVKCLDAMLDTNKSTFTEMAEQECRDLTEVLEDEDE